MDNFKPIVIVRAAPGGYRWKVVMDGQTIGTDTAATELDARNAANEVAARAAQRPTEGP